MFTTLLTVYPIRESLLGSLSAIDVARLLRALGEEKEISGRVRARYLSPLRDLFTDQQLLKMQHDLANLEDHHIVFWGWDLIEFLQGVPENLHRPDGRKLELWMTQVTTQRAHWMAKPEGSEGPWWITEDTALHLARRPKIDIPGEWWTEEVHPIYGGQKQLKTRPYEHMNNVRLHLHQSHEVVYTIEEFFWLANMWQIDIPVLKKEKWVGFNYDWMTRAASDFMPAGQHLHYMTTKDMKTFHVKTVRDIASTTQLERLENSTDRDLVLVYNSVFEGDELSDMQSCKIILSLKDGSPDEHSTGSLDLS